ncbi:MAG TPA: hypothetical protein VGE52_03660 [Pirellulales bacterium]
MSSSLATPSRLVDFRVAIGIGLLLVVSGAFHLACWAASGDPWEGPLSFRKPALFGLSAGVTLWALAWTLTRLYPSRFDRLFASALAVGLLVEVGLITLQTWRGEASHFNRATTLDAAIEATMLALILLVSVGVGWLCVRSLRLPEMAPSQAAALRGGLWLLLASCGLGLLATILGDVNLASGRPPETWGRAGVLKYPHGAALHAIQTLPLLAWLLERLRAPHARERVREAIAGHGALMASALWQTLGGRARFDLDAVGGTLLALAGLLLLPSLIAVGRGVGAALRAQASRPFARVASPSKLIQRTQTRGRRR